MANTGMLAAVARAAMEVKDEDEKEASASNCSCDPESPDYSPDCDCAEKDDKEEDKMQAAVLAERKRVLGIAAAAFPGQEKLALSLIDKGASLGDAALAFNADYKSKGQKVLAALDADETKVKGLRSEPANGSELVAANPLAGLAGEALWKAEFNRSAELQGEFTSEAAYVAFKKAEASGQARILNKKLG